MLQRLQKNLTYVRIIAHRLQCRAKRYHGEQNTKLQDIYIAPHLSQQLGKIYFNGKKRYKTLIHISALKVENLSYKPYSDKLRISQKKIRRKLIQNFKLQGNSSGMHVHTPTC